MTGEAIVSSQSVRLILACMHEPFGLVCRWDVLKIVRTTDRSWLRSALHALAWGRSKIARSLSSQSD
jgi:hypothetical protein